MNKSRNNDLRLKFNSHLKKLTGIDKDYYSLLKDEDVLELKTVLSDINNLLTYKLSLKAGEWIADYFHLGDNEKRIILENIDITDPNSSGFDIVINEPIKIIAEVKCNIPVKGGSTFGAMQSKKLIEDVQKLLNGNRRIENTNDFIKFLFIINIGERSEIAITKLTQKTKLRIENEERLNRNIARDNMEIIKDQIHSQLITSKVYIKSLD